MNINNFRKGVLIFILAILLIASFTPNSTGMLSEKKSNINKQVMENGLRNILVTGFWDPTGQMISQFSKNSELNPDGWKGENWEDLGFNICSYFPKPGSYTGDFEVDYQDTWEDFWRITEEVKPIAIISFGAGAGPWEIEVNALNRNSWTNDDASPYKPTPNPPDDTVPVDYIRKSTLPVENIMDAVNDQTTIDAWIDWDGNPGAYLCGYMAYLGMWYQNMHNTTDGIYPCRAAGFIHVNAGVPVDDAKLASEITIRETISHLKNLNLPPSIPTINGPANGNAGEEYDYLISSTEPDGDQVIYCIDWGDGSEEICIGPYTANEEVTITHSWSEEGTYTLKTKARDDYGAESDWATLEITMPRYKPQVRSVFLDFIESMISLSYKLIHIF